MQRNLDSLQPQPQENINTLKDTSAPPAPIRLLPSVILKKMARARNIYVIMDPIKFDAELENDAPSESKMENGKQRP